MSPAILLLSSAFVLAMLFASPQAVWSAGELNCDQCWEVMRQLSYIDDRPGHGAEKKLFSSYTLFAEEYRRIVPRLCRRYGTLYDPCCSELIPVEVEGCIREVWEHGTWYPNGTASGIKQVVQRTACGPECLGRCEYNYGARWSKMFMRGGHK